MVEQSQCTGGEHPTSAQGVTLCHNCTTDLETDLRAAAFLWGDIQTTCARQDVGSASVGSSGHKAPQPAANLDALDKAQTLRVVLGGWASHLPQLHPAGDPVKTALWLLTRIPEIRRQEWAGDLKRELREAINACRLSTDRAAERISLGVCGTECPGIMTAIVGGRVARCRLCGAVDSVQERQRWLISEAWHVAAPLTDIVRWLDEAKHARLNIKKVRAWVYAGKLQADAAGLFTPAAVLAAYDETPSGRREKQLQLA